MHAHWIRAGSLLLLLLSLGSCKIDLDIDIFGGGSTPPPGNPDVEGTDRSAILPVVRVDMPLPLEDIFFGEVDSRSRTHPDLALEFSLETVEGESNGFVDVDFTMVESTVAVDIGTQIDWLGAGFLLGAE